MVLSDLAIRRPVITSVMALIILIVGIISFTRLPVREYPNIDAPVISVQTTLRGAAPEVIESRVTRVLEDQLSTIDGLRIMRSTSREQVSDITLEFELGRDIDAAANDVRDRIGRVRSRLPQEVVEPRVAKQEADASPFMRIVFLSESLDMLQLTDWVDTTVRERLQTITGVGNIELRGLGYAMRIWLDPVKLAAHDLTAADVEQALRQQNVDIPGGRIESAAREFPIRVEGDLSEVIEFEELVLSTRGQHQIKLRDVARVELGSDDYRIQGFFKGVLSASIGVVRQSQSNLLSVAREVREELDRIKPTMPDGVSIEFATDESIFVERSVREVYQSIFIALSLVILIIFVFLRDWRSTMIPLIAIPVSIIGTFAIMQALGFTINILTLLALVLAVGLVVDDAIVMLENIYRRIEEGEHSVRAAVFGARQVAFAIIATTLVLSGVFLPVAFQSGQTGRLFYEFAITLAIAVVISSFIALTLTPMACSRLLKSVGEGGHGAFHRATEPMFVRMNEAFAKLLDFAIRRWWITASAAVVFCGTALWMLPQLQRELVPTEDRGVFRGFFNAPPGSTPEYVRAYARDIEMVLSQTPEIDRYFVLTGIGSGNGAFFVGFLKPWEERTRKTQDVMVDVNRRLAREITGGLARVAPVRPIGQRGPSSGDAFILVLRGTDFDKLQEIAATLAQRMRESGAFQQPRIDPSPIKPQLDVQIDRARAADLRVSASQVASTLETMFGGRRVTEFKKSNRTYDVILQMESSDRSTPSQLGQIYVRGGDNRLVQLSNLVSLRERVVAESYPHLDRMRAVNISTSMSPGRTIGDGVALVRELTDGLLPGGYDYVFDGETREFLDSGRDTLFLFGLALLFTFLILAAQFESWIHPITIFTGVALGLAAGVIVLFASRFWMPGGGGQTMNLFSQFGLIMLIGLVCKNGILIVEFANQLQVAGKDALTAAREAAVVRFRPILMTSISTVFGAMPLALASGAGAETRNALGIVVVGGLALSSIFTLFVIPVAYAGIDRLVRALTGKSSAYGLIRSQQISDEVEQAERDPIIVR
jgi:multidrug efflux pump